LGLLSEGDIVCGYTTTYLDNIYHPDDLWDSLNTAQKNNFRERLQKSIQEISLRGILIDGYSSGLRRNIAIKFENDEAYPFFFDTSYNDDVSFVSSQNNKLLSRINFDYPCE